MKKKAVKTLEAINEAYSNFDYDEDMLARLEETGGGEYDVVIADNFCNADRGVPARIERSGFLRQSWKATVMAPARYGQAVRHSSPE